MPRAKEITQPDGVVVRRKPRVGDLHWDGKVWRRWSGRRWTQAAYSLRPDRLLDPVPFATGDEVDAAARKRAVVLSVEDQVDTNGATVVFEGPGGVVLGYRPRVSPLLHLVLTLVTGGLWGFVWLYAVLTNREERIRLESDRWGNVWARSVAPV